MSNNYTHVSVRPVEGSGDSSITDLEARQLSDAIAYITWSAIAKVSGATLVVPTTGEPMAAIPPPDMSILKKFEHVSVFSAQAQRNMLRKAFESGEEPIYGDFIDEED